MSETMGAMTAIPVDRIQGFIAANPHLNFVTMDTSQGSVRAALVASGIEPDRDGQTLRAHQRLAAMDLPPETSANLIDQGLISANHIATQPRRRFVRGQAAKSGLSTQQAERLHRKAERIRNKTVQAFASAAGVSASRAARARRLDVASPGLNAFFEQLPGYADLFGTLDYCACEECRSILGPAAYLVDLLRIILEHVEEPNRETIPAALTFDARRPDIGKIALTCDNTNTLLPYLQIVNQRLIAQAAATLGVTSDKVLETLATIVVYPRQLPFNAPLDQIIQLLVTAGSRYGQILAAWNAPATVTSARSLGFSPEQTTILVKACVTADEVAPYFNVKAAAIGTLAEPATMMAKTGLTYAGLIDLIDQDLSASELAAGLQANFFIDQAAAGKLVQFEANAANKTVTIANLSVTALDRINRLMRLADGLGAPVTVADWAVRVVAPTGSVPDITADTLVKLDQLRGVAAAMGLSVIAACPMLGPIKTYGEGVALQGTSQGVRQGSPFDVLFNPPEIAARLGVYHPKGDPLNPTYTDTPLPWTPGATTSANITNINRVLPGLGLGLSDAAALGSFLFGPKASLVLDVMTLSALYRHVLLQRALRLQMASYLVLLSRAGFAAPATPTAAELLALLDLAAWLKSVTMTPYTLDYIETGTPSVYVNPLYRPDTVGTWQAGLIKSIPDPNAPDAGDAIGAAAAVLFATTTSFVAALLPIAVAGVSLPNPKLTWVQTFLAVDAKGQPLYPAYVADVVKRLSRWLVMQAALDLDAEQLLSVQTYPAAYGLATDFVAVSTASLRDIAQIAALMSTYGDPQGNILRYVALASTGGALVDQAAAIAIVTGWAPIEIEALLDPKTGPAGSLPVVAERLGRLNTCFTLMTALGADPNFIGGLVTLASLPSGANWTTYVSAAGDLLSKVAARYGDAWASIYAALDGVLQVHSRDALLAYVLSALNATYPDITTTNNVYEFLLIDVNMGPETQISYIREALNAAQLYLQRCRLGLEPGVLDLDIPDPWWQWMMNYRVWQANREIFLYPENYLIPTLRKNVTPQFSDLESALRQTQITDQSVASAFNAYMQGFKEVAQLRPVEAYHRVSGTLDARIETTFLFSCSNTSPNTFYYCQQRTGEIWTPWTKIDLPINASYVAPVYAFGKLFIFWSEINRSTSSTIENQQSVSISSPSATYKYAIHYSFLDENDAWIPAQTLLQDAVVLYQASGQSRVAAADSPLFKGLFELDNPAWQRVFVFTTSNANFVQPRSLPQDADRICVLYGPFLANLGATVALTDPPQLPDTDAMAFWKTLTERMIEHNVIVNGEMSGGATLGQMVVIDALLYDNVLLHRREFPLLDPYVAPVPLSWIGIQQPTAQTQIQVVHDAGPITQNYLGGSEPALPAAPSGQAVSAYSFATNGIPIDQAQKIYAALLAAKVIDAAGRVQMDALKTLDLAQVLSDMTVFNTFSVDQYMSVQKTLFANIDSATLFTTVSANAGISVVQNQPGSFLFDNGDETFLLEPLRLVGSQVPQSGPAFVTLEEGLSVGPPPLGQNSYITNNVGKTGLPVNAALSASIFQALQGFSLIGPNGVATTYATYANVKSALGNLLFQKKISESQIQDVLNVTMQSAFVFSGDAFISPSISQATGAAIFTALRDFSLIDGAYRLSTNILTGQNVAAALGNLLLTGAITNADLPGIFEVLATAPTGASLSYSNNGWASGKNAATSLYFNVTRMSTGAVPKLSRTLFVGGVDQLLRLQTQQIPVVPVLPFSRLGPNTTYLQTPAAVDGAQVDFDGLYGQYFWEIFYHVPMLIAYMLTTNQQFQNAQDWQQKVFNPTVRETFVTADVITSQTTQAISSTQAAGIITQLQSHEIGLPLAPILSKTPVPGIVNPQYSAATDLSFLQTADPSLTALDVTMVSNILLNYQLAAPASHYWQMVPFRTYTQQTLRFMLSDANPAVKVYEYNPFDPFAIARLRIGAFEKATVMQYIDNLILWGDQLFAQDSWETVVAASMLYVYASDILGPRPQQVGECPGSAPVTFDDIRAGYAKVGGGIPIFLIELEHVVPDASEAPVTPIVAHAFNDLNVYFCVPENQRLLSYWDRVEDRLYKIRHSQNLQGQTRTLALFEPPLNPLDLVKASMAANNVSAAAGANVIPVWPYRFTSMLAEARLLTGNVIELGSALLAAIEKRDNESLSLLTNKQQGQILNMQTLVLQQGIVQAQATVQALTIGQQSANNTAAYYQRLIDQFLSPGEIIGLVSTAVALDLTIVSAVLGNAAAIALALPQVGSPFAMTYGGEQLGGALQAASQGVQMSASAAELVAQCAQVMAGYDRRMEEWSMQLDVAQHESDNLGEQIKAAQAAVAVAQQELQIHLTSITQNSAIETFLTSKFTNEQLYEWLIGRYATLYYQTYHLALKAAQVTQKAYQFDTDTDATFLDFDYWQDARHGLTAGESLRAALDQMDLAYHQQNTRRYEIEKIVSLGAINPLALLSLKTTGSCQFDLTEDLFDYDYPGQYARKLVTVSVSIPTVIGPYQTIKATLTQTKNTVVTEPSIDAVNYLLGVSQTPPMDGLRSNWATMQSIALSTGVNDSGLFVIDFQDERYLPFENTGVVSSWRLDMPHDTNRFDFGRIPDVIVTLRYTALFDGHLQTQVRATLASVPYQGGFYVDCRRMRPESWFAAFSDESDPTKQTLSIAFAPEQLGWFKTLTIQAVIVQLDTAPAATIADGATFLSLTAPNETSQTFKLQKQVGTLDKLSWDAASARGQWQFVFDLKDPSIGRILTKGFVDPAKLTDLELVILYDGSVF